MTTFGACAIVLSASTVTTAACHRENSAILAPPTTTRSVELGTTSNDDAVMQVATTRCERELACNKIGRGRAYEDQPSCLEQIGVLMDDEFGSRRCPAGVERAAVARCVVDIQLSPCGGELERAPNLSSCTKEALCTR